MTPEQVKELVERLTAAYEKVAVYPEHRMRSGAVQELGEGFMDLLALRNLAPKAASALTLLAQEREELREALNEIIRREDKAWKPFQVFRSDRDVELDDARHDAWTEAANIARAALKDT